MAQIEFKVDGIDHVEVFVPDRYEAAKWYQAVLGLEIVTEFEGWATAGGPLMLSSDGGHSKLALFEGEPRGNRPTAGHHRVAFRVDGNAFVKFLNGEHELAIFDDGGHPIRSKEAVDHGQAFSIYFCDPSGNRYEITTYDYDLVQSQIAV